MHPRDLFDHIAQVHGTASDAAIAKYLGLTRARVSQLRQQTRHLSARQVHSYLEKARERGRQEAVSAAVRPLVEMYALERVPSLHDKKWELLPTSKANPRNQAIRRCLEQSRGIYLFFDSMGRALYVGKTERQSIWREMTSAYNRERSHCQAFFVAHPSTGTGFLPAHERTRRPVKRVVRLHETAAYFSAYEVGASLIPTLEALLVRSFCNTLSNKKMETF